MASMDEGAAQPWELPAPPTRHYAAPTSPEHGTGDAPPGYQPYRPAGTRTLNRYFFALAVLGALRAVQALLSLIAMVQTDSTNEVWTVNGWATALTISALYGLAAILFAVDSSWARVVSIGTDLFWVVQVLIWWSDLPDLGANATFLAMNLLATMTSLALAVRATPTRRGLRA